MNLRDLGGIPVAGGVTRRGALYRSGAGIELPDGVRTVIDLRNDDERETWCVPGSLHLPLDVSEDGEFWGQWGTGPQFGTPLYWRPHLERHPGRTLRVLEAIADAPPGGVLFHCQGGRDRSGQIAMAVLAVLGASPGTIADEYSLSPLEPDGAAHLEGLGLTAAAVIADAVQALPAYETAKLRARLVQADRRELGWEIPDS
jgi:protein-tyrosine phosphatase